MDVENPKIKEEEEEEEEEEEGGGGWSGLVKKPTTGKRSIRCTRSQVVPDWSLQEMLFLVNEVSSIESDFINTLSSYQKWKIISDNCATLGVNRSLNQCRTQWDLLFTGYKAIKEFEATTGTSYWSLLDAKALPHLGLPTSFDKDLFIFIDDNVQAQEDRRSGTDPDSDPDFKLTTIQSGSKKKRRCQRPRKSKNEEQEMAVKLREQADLIHAILKGDTESNSCNNFKSPGPGESPIEFRRWQGTELIKVLGSLVGALDRLSHIVQEG